MTEEQATYRTRKQTIFRTMKNEENPFVMIDRRPIENPELSWKAKGVLTYLLSRPNNWVVRIGDLIKRSPEGAFAVRGAINELIKAGHVYRREIKDEKGKFLQYELEVYELPFTGNPLVNFPQADNPQAGNHTFNNTNNTNNEFNSEDLQKIQNQADQSMETLLEFEKMAKDAESKGRAWNGREFIPPPFLPYADWFHAKTGLEMFGKKAKPKQDTSWLKEFKDWHDNEIDLESLNTAYEVENGWRREKSKIDQNITHPRELTAKAKAIAATPKAQERKPDGPVIHRATGQRQGITMQEAIARGLIPQKGS